MNNFLRGMASAFNLFPETDYMAMVPKKGEMLNRAARNVNANFSRAFEQQAKSVDGGVYLTNYRKASKRSSL